MYPIRSYHVDLYNPRVQSDDICRGGRNSSGNDNSEITNGRLAGSSKYVLSCPRISNSFSESIRSYLQCRTAHVPSFFSQSAVQENTCIYLAGMRNGRARGRKRAKEEIEAELTDWKLFGSRRSTYRVKKTIKTIIAN